MCTCIHKPSNYNLLNPVERKPHPLPKLRLRDQVKIAQKNKQVVLRELVDVVATKWSSRMGPNEPVKQIDKVVAIKNCITSIINKEIYACKEEKLKNEFGSIFGPVPHFDDLPTDFEARIKLIDPGKTIKTCNYSCPQKFKEAWNTLIEQHLKAGII